MGANAFGQSVLRREDQRLLTGQGRFTADLVPAGAAHAVMLRSPHAHAMIRSIDTAAACAAPGVLAVLTGADIEAAGLGGIPAGSDLSPNDSVMKTSLAEEWRPRRVETARCG